MLGDNGSRMHATSRWSVRAMKCQRSGLVVCIVGPDGSGKSTLAHELRAVARPRPEHRYWRPGWLPKPGRLVGHPDLEGVNTDPHGKPTHSRARAWFRTLYYFADFTLGYWMVYRPVLREGRHVVVERGWQDLLVDHRRYQLRGTRLVRRLSVLVPRPDVTVVLAVPPDVVLSRKRELTREEILRQTAAWRTVARSRRATLWVDGTVPAASLAEAVLWQISSTDAGERSRRIRPPADARVRPRS